VQRFGDDFRRDLVFLRMVETATVHRPDLTTDALVDIFG
jgi:hypothetical protein